MLAVVSAVTAGVTAVFAKAGLERVPSHLGNAVRTAMVLVLSLGILWWSASIGRPLSYPPHLGVSGPLRPRDHRVLGCLLQSAVDRLDDAGDGHP